MLINKLIILLTLFQLVYCDATNIISYEEALKLSNNEKILNIPILNQIEDSPAEGYCGESSIQMILAYYGLDKSQTEINKAGKPEHPDLYFNELIPAIENITNNQFMGHMMVFNDINYRDFIKYQIDTHIPVLCGFKLNPSNSPEWGADHVSVINGYDDNGLYILTTWDNNPRIYRTWEQLELTKLYTNEHDLGYSFQNLDNQSATVFTILISKNKSVK